MKCGFRYCIYNKRLLCTLDKVEIDEIGMCNVCIAVGIDEDWFEKAKEWHSLHRRSKDLTEETNTLET